MRPLEVLRRHAATTAARFPDRKRTREFVSVGGGGGSAGGSIIQVLAFRSYAADDKSLSCAALDAYGRVAAGAPIVVLPGPVAAGFRVDANGDPDPIVGGLPVSAAHTLEQPNVANAVSQDAGLNNTTVTTGGVTGNTVSLAAWSGSRFTVAITFPATTTPGVTVEVLRGASLAIESTRDVSYTSGTVTLELAVAGTEQYAVRVRRLASGGGTIRATHMYNRFLNDYALSTMLPRLFRGDPVTVFTGADGLLYTTFAFSAPFGAVTLTEF